MFIQSRTNFVGHLMSMVQKERSCPAKSSNDSFYIRRQTLLRGLATTTDVRQLSTSVLSDTPVPGLPDLCGGSVLGVSSGLESSAVFTTAVSVGITLAGLGSSKTSSVPNSVSSLPSRPFASLVCSFLTSPSSLCSASSLLACGRTGPSAFAAEEAAVKLKLGKSPWLRRRLMSLTLEPSYETRSAAETNKPIVVST